MDTLQIGQTTALGNSNYGKFRTDIVCPKCGYFAEAEGPQVAEKYLVLKCRRCQQPVLVEFNNYLHVTEKKVVDYYPKNKTTVDPFVPQEIAKDYLEAQRCFSVAAWQACAVMARRCMHLVVEHFKAQGKDLYQQIEDLKNKQLVTPLLAEAAQRVRALGKHGAHPYDGKGNPFTELEMEDASAALNFCDLIFDQVFIQPEKIKASQKRAR